jgi:hypothetical protein
MPPNEPGEEPPGLLTENWASAASD